MKPHIPPNTTDIVLFCFLLFFFLDGWRKGFFKSAIGPITFVFCSLIGIIYFDLTQNFVKAIFITAVATMIINIIILIIFTLGQRSVDPAYRDYSPRLGRLLGSVTNMTWQGCILFIIAFLVTVAPFQVYGLNKIQTNIQQSYSYFFLARELNELPAMQKIITAFSIFENSDQMQQLSTTQEFQYFFSNPKVQSLLQDEIFMKDLKERNIPKIMSNPRILDVFKDNTLMENFGKLAGKVYSLDRPAPRQEILGTNNEN